MKDTLRIAGVYVGTIIGAGYASGQEILQFFTGYGWWGILGTVVTMILYPLLGYYLVVLGKRVKAWSHKTLIYHICGKYLGAVVDILLAFFLFGVGVIMIAGSGSLFQQIRYSTGCRLCAHDSVGDYRTAAELAPGIRCHQHFDAGGLLAWSSPWQSTLL